MMAAACASTPQISSSHHYKLDPGQMHAVTYTARGRGAYVLRDKDNKWTKLCAEPFPDAVASESAQRETGLDVQAALTYAAIAGNLGLKSNDLQKASADIVDVAERTEVVLVLREALYRVCEANLNGTLTAEDTKAAFDGILSTARSLGQRNVTTALVKSLELEKDAATKAKIVQAIVTIALAEAGAASSDATIKAALFGKAIEGLHLKKPEEEPPGG